MKKSPTDKYSFGGPSKLTELHLYKLPQPNFSIHTCSFQHLWQHNTLMKHLNRRNTYNSLISYCAFALDKVPTEEQRSLPSSSAGLVFFFAISFQKFQVLFGSVLIHVTGSFTQKTRRSNFDIVSITKQTVIK